MKLKITIKYPKFTGVPPVLVATVDIKVLTINEFTAQQNKIN
jgi:hypothetical protein